MEKWLEEEEEWLGGGEEFICVVEEEEEDQELVSDEIRATVIDHVINHGLSMREAGQRVQPNLQRSTVASIVRVFRQTNR